MDNLRIIREKKNITQLRLSVEAGVAQETISGYELGKTKPSVETLCKMANFLGTSVDYLLGRTDVQTPISQLIIDSFSAAELEMIVAYKKLNKEQKGKALGFMMGMVEE